MKTTKISNTDGSVTQTNWMLDEIIDSFNNHSIDNDDLIKEMLVQKIEFARKVVVELLWIETDSKSIKDHFKEIDAKYKKMIIEFRGTPNEFFK